VSKDSPRRIGSASEKGTSVSNKIRRLTEQSVDIAATGRKTVGPEVLVLVFDIVDLERETQAATFWRWV